MAITIENVSSTEEIARAILDVVDSYYLDTIKYAHLTIMDFYRLVRNIPYCVEFGEYQNLQRPGYTLNGHGPFTACANKTIAICSYLKVKGIPYRIKIVCDYESDQFHHVFPEAELSGKWIPMDATYKRNSFGEREQWGREKEVYP